MFLIKNHESVIAQLRPKLEEYLQRHGINTSANFSCIHPDHADSNPSCGIQGNDKETFHCFGCHAAGDIFTAAHYLEGKPLRGAEFIFENVGYLAEIFGIEIEKEEPTEMQLYEFETYRAYAAAAEYVALHRGSDKVKAEIEKRGWDEELMREHAVGSVVSFKDFKEHLKQVWQVSFLNDIDLDRSQMFNENSLIFTIKDEHGRPVGFASRDLEGKGRAKYVNQTTTGVKCNIYQKGKRLYGLDYLVKQHKKGNVPVYVFEGYTDVLTARQHGLANCVGLGGTAFTTDQLYLLKDHNFTDIILCLDGDGAGRDNTARLLDSVLVGHKDITVKIVNIPEDHDPDSFIRENGLDEFIRLQKWTAFEWRLMHFDGDSDDDEAVCNAMIPFIVSEQNIIKQRGMIHHLSSATGVDVATLHAEVQRQANQQEHRKAIERENILARMAKKLQRDPSAAETAIAEAQSSLYDLMRQYNEDNLSEEACVGKMKIQKEKEESKSDEFSGFILGKDLEYFQNALNGEWKEDVFCVVGGKANSGKTSYLVKLAYEIARHEEENNACVIYHSIDDTAEQVLPKFVTVADGSRRLQINQVANPNYYMQQGCDIQEKREVGYATMMDLARRGRLILKDANDGQSLIFVESLMRYYRGKYPERRLVFVLDNFHKLRDFADPNAGREVYRTMSQRMKYLAGKYHICIISTVEYTKLPPGERPTNYNIGECLTGDTRIFNFDTGKYCRIDECEVGQKVLTLGEDQRMIPSAITAVLDKGLQHIYKVTLKSGRHVRTTMGHPFFGENGWTKLQDLEVGSFIGIPRSIKPFSVKADSVVNLENKYKARLLGLLAGDGCYREGDTPSFINKDANLIHLTEALVGILFGLKATRSEHNGSTNLSFGGKKNHTNPLTAFLKEVGLWGQIKEHKRVPSFVKDSNSRDLMACYIAGLIETDGSIQGAKGTEKRITFTNKSSHLVYELQSMLLRFGIHSTVRPTKDSLLRLTVSNADICQFAKFIPVSSYKGDELRTAALRKSSHNFYDRLPPRFTQLAKEVRGSRPVRYPDGYYIQKPTVSRRRAQLIAAFENDTELMDWATSDIYWDQIESVEYEGEEQAWDLTVENTHNFVANDIFCHNTVQIEYDANLALHIYNDLHDMGDRAQDFHIADDGTGQRIKMPRVEMAFGKNKITAFKNKLYFDFFPASSDFENVKLEAVEHDRDEQKGNTEDDNYPDFLKT